MRMCGHGQHIVSIACSFGNNMCLCLWAAGLPSWLGYTLQSIIVMHFWYTVYINIVVFVSALKTYIVHARSWFHILTSVMRTLVWYSVVPPSYLVGDLYILAMFLLHVMAVLLCIVNFLVQHGPLAVFNDCSLTINLLLFSIGEVTAQKKLQINHRRQIWSSGELVWTDC